MTKHVFLIAHFFEYCEKEKEFKGSTLRTYVEAFRPCITWFVVFRVSSEEQFIIPHYQLAGLMAILCTMNKAAGKRIVKDNKSKTVDNSIWTRKYPAGGMPELQNAVSGGMEFVNCIVKKIPLTSRDISSHSINKFLQLMLASLWTNDVNARPKAVSQLRISQFSEMVENKFTLHEDFKTSAKFGYQPIIARGVSIYIMQIYYEHIRPLILTEKSGDYFYLDGMQDFIY